ncbi:hypothetical protein Taro_034492 [Colocasia esculenta]|uniref:Uncharacterized protein n=1 Tax=Colocasia esculenta TaxID=4460 RepID=A0A843WA79_COLES|nr:hypothetical protein [Colocasia esculenta]
MSNHHLFGKNSHTPFPKEEKNPRAEAYTHLKQSGQIPHQVMKTKGKTQRTHGMPSFAFDFGALPVGGIC